MQKQYGNDYDRAVRSLRDGDRYEESGESEYSRERSDPYEMVEYLLDKDFSGKGPKGYQRSDASIYEDACEILFRSPNLDASDIEVVVEGKKVTLNGSVRDRESKRIAELELETFLDIFDIQNNLRVEKHHGHDEAD